MEDLVFIEPSIYLKNQLLAFQQYNSETEIDSNSPYQRLTFFDSLVSAIRLTNQALTNILKTYLKFQSPSVKMYQFFTFEKLDQSNANQQYLDDENQFFMTVYSSHHNNNADAILTDSHLMISFIETLQFEQDRDQIIQIVEEFLLKYLTILIYISDLNDKYQVVQDTFT